MSLTPERVSLSLVSLSFFHGLSHALHLPSRQSSCLFPLIYPPPLRVTSPSFIARVTAFRRSNHEIISRYSSLSVGRRAAGFFQNFSYSWKSSPFSVHIPSNLIAIASKQFIDESNFPIILMIVIREIIWKETQKLQISKILFVRSYMLVRFSVNKNPNMFQNTFQKYFYRGNDKKTCQILIVHSMKGKEIKKEIKKIGNRSFP